MSGSNIKYKSRKGNENDKNTDKNHISIINSYLLYYNRSYLPTII